MKVCLALLCWNPEGFTKAMSIEAIIYQERLFAWLTLHVVFRWPIRVPVQQLNTQVVFTLSDSCVFYLLVIENIGQDPLAGSWQGSHPFTATLLQKNAKETVFLPFLCVGSKGGVGNFSIKPQLVGPAWHWTTEEEVHWHSWVNLPFGQYQLRVASE